MMLSRSYFITIYTCCPHKTVKRIITIGTAEEKKEEDSVINLIGPFPVSTRLMTVALAAAKQAAVILVIKANTPHTHKKKYVIIRNVQNNLQKKNKKKPHYR